MITLRPKHPQGLRSALTPLQEVELLAWFKARKALGTFKSKAFELNTSRAVLYGTVQRLLRRAS